MSQTRTAPRTQKQLGLPRIDYLISAVLAAVAGLTPAATLFLPDVLRGEAAMSGSARGTAAVMLVVGVPTLLVAMWQAGRGSARAVFVWFGTVL
ncbi:MAG: hypothetical protein WBB15_01475 [Ornithinimicrobium sp.]